MPIINSNFGRIGIALRNQIEGKLAAGCLTALMVLLNIFNCIFPLDYYGYWSLFQKSFVYLFLLLPSVIFLVNKKHPILFASVAATNFLICFSWGVGKHLPKPFPIIFYEEYIGIVLRAFPVCICVFVVAIFFRLGMSLKRKQRLQLNLSELLISTAIVSGGFAVIRERCIWLPSYFRNWPLIIRSKATTFDILDGLLVGFACAALGNLILLKFHNRRLVALAVLIFSFGCYFAIWTWYVERLEPVAFFLGFILTMAIASFQWASVLLIIHFQSTSGRKGERSAL